MSAPKPTPRYLNFLPAVYRDVAPGEARPLVESYLKTYEKILTGLEPPHGESETLFERKGLGQTLDILGQLFDPRLGFLFPDSSEFLPPLADSKQEQHETQLNSYVSATNAPYSADAASDFQKQFSAWLADLLGWMGDHAGIALNTEWDADTKRRINATEFPNFRLRGTAAGLAGALRMYLGPRAVRGIQSFQGDTLVSGIEVYDLSQNYLPAQLNATTPGDTLSGYRINGGFILRSTYTEGAPVLSAVRPYASVVRVHYLRATRTDVDAFRQRFERVLEREAPAIRHLKVQEIMPWTLGPDSASRLGENTYLEPAKAGADQPD